MTKKKTQNLGPTLGNFGFFDVPTPKTPTCEEKKAGYPAKDAEPPTVATSAASDAREPADGRAPVETAPVVPGSTVGRDGAPVGVAVGVAVGEVLGFPVGLLRGLPVPTTLHAVSGAGVAFRLTTSRESYAAARAARVPVFAIGETMALALASQEGRVFPKHFEAMLARKAAAPEWYLTERAALAGLVGEREPVTGDFAALLARLGATLQAVEVHA